MSLAEAHRSRPSPAALLWLLSTAAFPLAGLAGRAVAGPVDGGVAGLLGGAVTGAVIGVAQSITSARRLRPLAWTLATAAGSAVGLAAGATAVQYRTDLADLIAQGAITGVAVGLAQALALPDSWRRRLLWAAASPALWASGWAVTTLAGVDVDAQYTVFGLTGALTCTLLSGALLTALIPATDERR